MFTLGSNTSILPGHLDDDDELTVCLLIWFIPIVTRYSGFILMAVSGGMSTNHQPARLNGVNDTQLGMLLIHLTPSAI